MYISIHEFHAAVFKLMRITESGYKKFRFQRLIRLGPAACRICFIFLNNFLLFRHTVRTYTYSTALLSFFLFNACWASRTKSNKKYLRDSTALHSSAGTGLLFFAEAVNKAAVVITAVVAAAVLRSCRLILAALLMLRFVGHMFSGLHDPDTLVRGADPDPDPSLSS